MEIKFGMLQTIYFYDGNNLYDKSTAVIKILNNLDGFFDRNTYYNLINYALEQNFIDQNLLYLPSLNIKHTIGKVA